MECTRRTATRYLTIAETAKLLGIGRSKLYNILDSGELKAVKIGQARRIPEDELIRYQSSLMGA